MNTNPARPLLEICRRYAPLLFALALTPPLAVAELQPSQILRGSEPNPRAMVLSEAAGQAYSASFGVIQHWERDSTSGDLSLIATYEDSAPPAVESEPSVELVISPDKRFLYVLYAATEGVLEAFSIAPVHGTLTSIQRLDLTGAAEPAAMALSPDGDHLYAGGSLLSIFSRDTASGLLTSLDALDLGGTAGLSFTVDGSKLLHANDTGGLIRSMSRDSGDGSLTELDRLSTFTTDPTFSTGELAALATGEDRFYALVRTTPFFRVTNLALIDVDPAGLLSVAAIEQITFVSGSAEGLAVRADTEEVALGFFDFNGGSATARLYAPTIDGTALEQIDSLFGGRRVPTGLIFSPAGDQLYVGGFGGLSLAVLPTTGDPGELMEPLPSRRVERPVALFATEDELFVANPSGVLQAAWNPSGVDLESWTNSPRELGAIALAPNGRHLYAASARPFESFAQDVALFSRAAADGPFDGTQILDDIKGPLTVTPSGGHLIYIDPFQLNLFAATLDTVSGEITARTDLGVSVDRPRSLRMTSDGEHLLMVDEDTSNDIAPFGRYFRFNASGPSLTELSVSSLIGVESEAFAVSADGTRVYSIWRESASSLAIAVFERAGDFILFLGSVPIGEPGDVSSILWSQIELDPAGRYLYAFDGVDWLGVFSLAGPGFLPTLVTSFQQGVDGVDWLGTCCIRLATATDRLYLSDHNGSTLVTFDWRILFADGFESADTSAWSDVSPAP